MSSLSLDASIRTCKVDTGEATRIESDRFLNPNNMVCVPWNGYNSKGQQVCADSYYTKTAGCNSALERVSVETFLRPDYTSYITLSAQGIQGDIYGNGNPTSYADSKAATAWNDSRDKITGSFGNQWRSSNYMACGLNSYERAMAQTQQADRMASYANNSYQSDANRSCSGF